MVVLKVRKAERFLGKSIGLIGRQKAFGLLLKTRFGIHTFLLKFPIDVIVVDKYNKVMFLKKNLEPNKIFFWNPKYDTAIELPKGTIQKKEIKIGSKIKIITNLEVRN